MNRSITLRPESAILRETLAVLALYRHGGHLQFERQNTMATMLPGRLGRLQLVRAGTPGRADITGVLKGGRSFAIEVKREGWTPRDLSGAKARLHFARQIAYLDGLNRVGGLGIWINCAEQAKRFLERAIAEPCLRIEIGKDQFCVMVAP